MEQCFIGHSPRNKAAHSNSNKAEQLIWLETVVTFAIIEYVSTINSAVASIQIPHAISLIGEIKRSQQEWGEFALLYNHYFT